MEARTSELRVGGSSPFVRAKKNEPKPIIFTPSPLKLITALKGLLKGPILSNPRNSTQLKGFLKGPLKGLEPRKGVL